ncbi:MAG: hypothetical protein V1701_02785 [Planctomycetota bacterium]
MITIGDEMIVNGEKRKIVKVIGNTITLDRPFGKPQAGNSMVRFIKWIVYYFLKMAKQMWLWLKKEGKI